MTREAPSSSNAVWTATDLRTSPHERGDKAERVRSMFAAIAGRYDLNNRLHSFGQDQRWRRRAVRLAGIAPGDRALDVACGTGDLTEALAAARPAEVTGLDFTDAMLDIARSKAAGRRRGDDVPDPTYVQGDATAMPFEDASYDVVTIAFGIRNVSEPERALREFRRVLRPGGRLVILEFSKPRNPVLRWMSTLYTDRIMPVTASWLARDRSGAYRYLPKSVETFLDRDALAARMEDVGFADVSQHVMSGGICVAYRGVVPESAV
jgi:demethylmenaquinone methyltransferase/2-methoxy-6-polyprenyl-1,4-benzoquinol methylase